MKSAGNVDEAVRYLELLATRVWLLHATDGENPDLPQFVARDQVCSDAQTSENIALWAGKCVPARADQFTSPHGAIVKLSLSPGVPSEFVLSEIKQVLLSRSLGIYSMGEPEAALIENIIEDILRNHPSLRGAYETGWLASGGRTYPVLERLFATGEIRFGDVLNAMVTVVFSETQFMVDDMKVTTLVFFPTDASVEHSGGGN